MDITDCIVDGSTTGPTLLKKGTHRYVDKLIYQYRYTNIPDSNFMFISGYGDYFKIGGWLDQDNLRPIGPARYYSSTQLHKSNPYLFTSYGYNIKKATTANGTKY
jgi:hypothetical protein